MSVFSNLQTLQGYLNVVTDRQQLIVSNMANVDTPGYHTRDLDFQAAMRHVINGEDSPQMEPKTQLLPSLPERPDGNNVNVDREGLMLSQTQLQHQIGVQLVKSELHKLYTAINET
jgi:flagellar basal-body rod protein FlgB